MAADLSGGMIRVIQATPALVAADCDAGCSGADSDGSIAGRYEGLGAATVYKYHGLFRAGFSGFSRCALHLTVCQFPYLS